MNEFLPESIELDFTAGGVVAAADRDGQPIKKPGGGLRMGLVTLSEHVQPSGEACFTSKNKSSVNQNTLNRFPDATSRPCYRVYETGCGPESKYRPGVYYHAICKSAHKEPPALQDIRLCGVLTVAAIARNKQGREFGLVLEFKDRLGQHKRWNMPCRLLGGRGDELQKELFDHGLDINYQQRNKLADYISRQTPAKTVWITAQCGWFDQVFVLPHRVVGKSAEAVWFQSDGWAGTDSESVGYRVSGSLAEWQTQVARFCLGNPLLLLNVSQAFSGALLAQCQLDCVAVHVFGGSSQGKTSGMLLAGSVWGEPKRFNRSWTATLNGLESAAVSVNDGLLCLDEMSKADALDVSKSLYMLANGMGKQRSTVSGKAKAFHTWRVAILSNGEESIEAHLQKAGLSAKAGELVRFLQLPIFGEHGAFDALHGMASGRAFSALLARNAGRFHGCAGLAFLEKLTRDGRDFTELLDRCLAIFEKQNGPLSPQEGRAARAFALIGLAGELASEYGVTGWPQRAAMDAALVCFAEWRRRRGRGELEPKKLVETVRQYVELYGDTRFTRIQDGSKVHIERSGYWRLSDAGDRQWLFSPAGLKKAIQYSDFNQAVKLLIQEGVLKRGSQKNVTQVKSHGVTGRYYLIQFKDDDHAE